MRREIILPACRPIAAYADITDEQWHELRKEGIGGSEASTIMDANRYNTRLSLWMVKTGRMTNDVSNEFTEMGTLLEPFIRRELVGPWLEARNPATMFDVLDPTHVYQSNDWPWMRANVDGFVRMTDRIVGLEIKTGSSYVLKEWGGVDGDEIPDAYYWQVQHYMAVTGLDEWYVFGVIGNQRLLRVVPRNQADIARLIDASREFWQLVELNDPLYAPMPTGHDADMDALLAGFPMPRDETADLTDVAEDLELYVELGSQIKALESEREEAKQKVFAAMQDRKWGEYADYKVTRVQTSYQQVDGKRLRAEMPEIAEKYERTIEKDYPLIRRRK